MSYFEGSRQTELLLGVEITPYLACKYWYKTSYRFLDGRYVIGTS